MIGTTRSRVSFFMNKFGKLGFIDYNGTMHVHSSLLNVVLHDYVPTQTGDPYGTAKATLSATLMARSVEPLPGARGSADTGSGY